MRSNGRLIEGFCWLQSTEYNEIRSLDWDELPHTGIPGAHDRRVTATEELQSMSADGRATKEYRGKQTHDELRRQEACAVDVRHLQGPITFFRDAITGHSQDPRLVREARQKELQYFESKRVWHKRPRSEAYKFKGKPFIVVKWVDVSKGGDESPNYRSRLVAREIQQAGKDTIFAPTPPLESLRTILNMAATDLVGDVKHARRADSEDRTQIMVLDISRAYFDAKKDEGVDPTYVSCRLKTSTEPTVCMGSCGSTFTGRRQRRIGGTMNIRTP